MIVDKIRWWNLKIEWDDGTEEYIDDIPNYVAKHVDEFLSTIEDERHEEKQNKEEG
jgi:hypothetical protein|tara:strand:- start:245 stop:412 length:168 start_codon:yes stop_codon:yes gene_type:complete